jgi:hypothetical protein
MVSWARRYATSPVTYTRDANDCTTFVSWAMWKGGWAEKGTQSYPSVTWNRNNDDVCIAVQRLRRHPTHGEGRSTGHGPRSISGACGASALHHRFVVGPPM